MATHRQNDVRVTGSASKQNLIPPARNTRPGDTTVMIRENQSMPPVTTDQYQHTETVWRLILDGLSLAILTTVTVISHYVAMPFTRGFFCADMTIKYPYKTNTIPAYAAVILSIGLPIVWMWTTEFAKHFYFVRYPKQIFLTKLELCGQKVARVTPFKRNLYILTVVFAYGYLATWVLTEVTKNFVGELRPHFLAVCQPSVNCSDVTNLNRFYSYLQHGSDYTCLNPDEEAVREARRSFFSGHTAPLFFGFGWLIMYIHVSWSWRHLGIVGHLFQVGIAILGLYIGYTRISDFHHHWHDVCIGAIVGSLVAFVTFKFILNWRHYHPKFLPYTVARITQNDSVHLNHPRRISPEPDNEHNHYF